MKNLQQDPISMSSDTSISTVTLQLTTNNNNCREYNVGIFVFCYLNMVQKLYRGSQFPNRHPERKIKKTVCHTVYKTHHTAKLNYILSL